MKNQKSFTQVKRNIIREKINSLCYLVVLILSMLSQEKEVQQVTRFAKSLARKQGNRSYFV